MELRTEFNLASMRNDQVINSEALLREQSLNGILHSLQSLDVEEINLSRHGINIPCYGNDMYELVCVDDHCKVQFISADDVLIEGDEVDAHDLFNIFKAIYEKIICK